MDVNVIVCPNCGAKNPDGAHFCRNCGCALNDSFQPALTLPVTVITDLFKKTDPPVNMYTKNSPDELKPKLK